MIVAPLDDDSDIFVDRPLHPGARFLDLAVTGHKHVRHVAICCDVLHIILQQL